MKIFSREDPHFSIHVPTSIFYLEILTFSLASKRHSMIGKERKSHVFKLVGKERKSKVLSLENSIKTFET